MRPGCLFFALITTLGVSLLLGHSFAQQERQPRQRGNDGPPPRSFPNDRQGRGPDRRFDQRGPDNSLGDRDAEFRARMMKALPIIVALDTNKNGRISKSEMANAAKALRTLDKDKNGKLTREEYETDFRILFGGGGPGGPPGFGGQGFGGPGAGEQRGGRDRDRRPQNSGRPDRPQRDGSPQQPGPTGNSDLVSRIMARDSNKDGKITMDEMPDFLKDRLKSIDSNKNGTIERSEVESFAKRFQSPRQ